MCSAPRPCLCPRGSRLPGPALPPPPVGHDWRGQSAGIPRPLPIDTPAKVWRRCSGWVMRRCRRRPAHRQPPFEALRPRPGPASQSGRSRRRWPYRSLAAPRHVCDSSARNQIRRWDTGAAQRVSHGGGVAGCCTAVAVATPVLHRRSCLEQRPDQDSACRLWPIAVSHCLRPAAISKLPARAGAAGAQQIGRRARLTAAIPMDNP